MTKDNTIAGRFLGQSHQSNQANYRQAKMLVNIALLTSLITFCYLIISFILDFERGVYLMALDVVGFLLVAFLVRKRIDLDVLANLYIAIGAFAINFLIIYSGGISSPLIL